MKDVKLQCESNMKLNIKTAKVSMFVCKKYYII